MRILLDTNIIIAREDNRILRNDLKILSSFINKLKIEVLYHPKSIEDIRKNKNKNRKQIILSKIKSYQELENPPDPSNDEYFKKLVGEPKSPNDIVDNCILYAIHKNSVNFLITEDQGIHKKSIKLRCDDRVLSIIDAIILLKKDLPKEKLVLPPALNSYTVHNLNIDDPFFDSLKREYPDFEIWFEKISRDGRNCWVYYKLDGSIGALLIYKFENEQILSTPPQSKKKRLKISTMKVSRVGYKIGELLIKLAIELSVNNSLPEIYLTHFTKDKDNLVDLITEFGYNYVGKLDKNNEDVYLKKILINKNEIIGLSPVEISKNFYPNFYDGQKVKKHIIPIQPKYHQKLFTDYRRQSTLNKYFKKFIVEGNTIKKAYLCHAASKKLEVGDILLFYRSKDKKAITTLGVIESVYYDCTDRDHVISIVGKRTVYSLKEIEKIVKKPTTIILFNFHFHLKKPIGSTFLIGEDILKGPPQSIMQIKHKHYLLIKKKGEIDKHFTFN